MPSSEQTEWQKIDKFLRRKYGEHVMQKKKWIKKIKTIWTWSNKRDKALCKWEFVSLLQVFMESM